MIFQSGAYTRIITPLQFRRMLHFLTINVTEEDFKLLCKKFIDEGTEDINYPAFVQSIDARMFYLNLLQYS